MPTPLDKIESGISGNNMNIVAEGFKELTGKTVKQRINSPIVAFKKIQKLIEPYLNPDQIGKESSDRVFVPETFIEESPISLDNVEVEEKKDANESIGKFKVEKRGDSHKIAISELTEEQIEESKRLAELKAQRNKNKPTKKVKTKLRHKHICIFCDQQFISDQDFDKYTAVCKVCDPNQIDV